MMVFDSQCQRCKHLIPGTLQCAAFPDGIPPEMFDELEVPAADHRKPFPDDQGIRWEPITPGTKHPLDEQK